MPEDCLEGGLLSWEMERRGARPLLAAELLLWAGDGLGLEIEKKLDLYHVLSYILKGNFQGNLAVVLILRERMLYQATVRKRGGMVASQLVRSSPDQEVIVLLFRSVLVIPLRIGSTNKFTLDI